MTCPKCGHENFPGRDDCARCGVIFARIPQRPPLQGPAVIVSDPSSGPHRAAFTDLLFLSPESSRVWHLGGLALALLVMTFWGGTLVFSGRIADNAAGQSVLHLVNLPFHEAGHVIFRPLGRFITSLGGTLGQLLVPFLCLATLLVKTRDPLGGAVCLWWFGENFLDIAPYINDARAGVMPLLGGNSGQASPYGFHDWEYLLTETGLLRYDHALARFSHLLGALIMATAVLWAGLQLHRLVSRRGGA